MSASAKRPRYDKHRGRHKKRASNETRVWERDHLIPPRPPWMAVDVYRKLAELRKGEL